MTTSLKTTFKAMGKIALLAIGLIAVSCTGCAQSVSVTPSSLSFGNVPVNMTSDDPQFLTLAN
ncbi:MAG TPA: hypothetical protein VMO76_11265 [Candidatus Udaeobacter sp.]|nr:hypothetical protein [Candidatus Udaeobacter sp.]